MTPRPQRLLGGLWGSLAGDALGVPVEFRSRSSIRTDPVTGMRGFGTHHQPPGTWSDDSSLLLCTVESLLPGSFNPTDLADRFVRWKDGKLWTPHGSVFDIGIATSTAISRLAGGMDPLRAGGSSESSNGNGSLMRILPLCLRCASEPTASMAQTLAEASCLTHAHPRSQLACIFLGLFTRALLGGGSPADALAETRQLFPPLADSLAPAEQPHFQRLLEPDFAALPESDIQSSGYVIHTLEASLWCLLHTASFPDATLRAVNLGDDTDTTGCVTGGIAGIHYGLDAIPASWIDSLARRNDVAALFDAFVASLPA
jgi:ADP-ribosyl-[dinitrogen reductase] hydrolase